MTKLFPRYVWVSENFWTLHLLDKETNNKVAKIDLYRYYTIISYIGDDSNTQTEKLSADHPVCWVKEYVEGKLDIPHSDVGTYSDRR